MDTLKKPNILINIPLEKLSHKIFKYFEVNKNKTILRFIGLARVIKILMLEQKIKPITEASIL